MKIEQNAWTRENGWKMKLGDRLGSTASLVLVFGSTELLKDKQYLDEVRSSYSNAHILGCSTAGEIYGPHVCDDSIVTAAVEFESTHIEGAQVKISEVKNSLEAGEQLARLFKKEGLVHILVLSDGLNVNGSELVEGMTRNLPVDVSLTGGLSGDGERFQETLVFLDSPPEAGCVAAIGFYGDRLKVSYGSLGGWDPFGPERLVTRSEGNVLYELDRKSALELYKTYLGEHAKGLPATGLLFPLSLRMTEGEKGIVRTILSIDEQEQSMTFAGDVPKDSYVRLMKANFDRLIDGSLGAAKTSYDALGSTSPDLAILISCVGRKLVLKQRVEEEVEGVREVLGDQTPLTGFYSYGEISPFSPTAKCELHNQTMTITAFLEK